MSTLTTNPTFNENVLGFAVAYGLALQGLKAARLQTNLLPPEIRVDRLIRAKKPWAAAAAGLLLLGAAGLGLGYTISYRAVAATVVKTAETQAKSVVDQDTRLKADFIDATASRTYLRQCKGRTPNCQGGKCRSSTGGAFGRWRAGGFS